MTNATVPHAVILSGRKGKCVPDFARTVARRVEGSLALPLSTRFFDSVLTVSFSTFLTCHSMPPRITNGAVPHAVILSGRKEKCMPDFARTVVAARRISRFTSLHKILRLSSHRSVFRISHLSFHTAAQNDEWRSPPRRHPERSERKMCA